MSMHRLLVIVVFITALIVVPAQRADACSCALLPVDEMLEIHDAAFIGTLTGVSGPVVRGDLGEEAVFTFQVDEWLVGDGAATVDVRSATSGAACGFEIPVGTTAGVFLSAGPGGWHGGLCSTMAADVLRAGLTPLDVESNGPPAAVVYGGSGKHRIIAIDGSGNVTALLPDDGAEHWVNDVSICPGGTHLLENTGEQIVIRTLSDLREVARYDVARGDSYVVRAWCRAEDGSAYLAQVRQWNGQFDETRVVDETFESLVRGRYRTMELVGDAAVAVLDEGTGVVRIDLNDGTVTELYRVGIGSGYGGPEVLAGSGSLVAFSSTVYGPGGFSGSDLVVIDGSTGDVVAARPLDYEAGAVSWIGADRLAVSAYDGTPPRVYAFPDLEKVPAGGWDVWNSAPIANGALAIREGTLMFSAGDGPVTDIRTFPNQTLWNIALIDGTAVYEASDESPPPTTTTAPLDGTTPDTTAPSPVAGPTAAEAGFPWLPAVVVVGAVWLAFGLLVLNRRRKTP